MANVSPAEPATPTWRSSMDSSKTPFLPAHEDDADLSTCSGGETGRGRTRDHGPEGQGRGRFLHFIVLLLAALLILRTIVDWKQATGLPSGCPCACGPSQRPEPSGDSEDSLRTHRQQFYNASSQFGIARIPWSEDEWMTWYNNWEALMPIGRGMVKIHHPEDYPDLPPPMEDPPKDGGYKYEVAVTHQLHCLWSIQRYFYEVQAGIRPGDHWTTMFHINHCTDYLRWTLLCHADTTIEGWDEEQLNNPTRGGKHQFDTGPTGLHAMHQCTDYSHVSEWMEHNRWDDLRAMDHGIKENATYADWNRTWRVVEETLASHQNT